MKSRHASVTVHVPMAFAIRGGRKMIISEVPETPDEGLHPSLEADRAQRISFQPAPRQRTDNALHKALARAYRWRRMIESGEYATITELAKAEHVNQSYACRMMRLTLLAPHVVTTILNRRDSSDLMLKQLMKPLPVRWDEQAAKLKIGGQA